MKNKFIKILSLILVMASLVSALAIFISADGTSARSGNAVGLADIELLYNRNFEEGWDYDNAFTTTQLQNNKASIDKEELANGDYNYFMRLESTQENASGSIAFDFGTSVAKDGQIGTVIEMRIKADDYIKGGSGIFSYADGSKSTKNNMLYVTSDNELVFDYNNEKLTIGTMGDEWINLALAFDWTASKRTITVHYGELDKETRTYQYKKTCVSDYGPAIQNEKGLSGCSFAFPKGLVGAGYCVDDLRIYNGSSVPVVLDSAAELDAGSKVNTLAPKVITILKNANTKSASQILADALCMKIGVNYVLSRNERKPIYEGGKFGAPVIVDGEVRISLDLILNYIGFPYLIHEDEMSYDITTGTTATYLTVGRTVATVAGERVMLSSAPGYVTTDAGDKYLTIAMSDIEKLFPGWAVTYDEMGLILLYEEIISDETGEKVDIVNRNTDLDVMLDIMKKFIFDVNTDTLKESYINTGKGVYEDVKQNTKVGNSSFNHPYLIVNQSGFDALKDKYKNGSDAAFKAYVKQVLDKADAIYNDIASLDGSRNYEGIKNSKSPLNKYSDGKTDFADTEDGYSPDTGRVDTLVGFTDNLIPLAFAYQITGDLKYARLAYDYMAVLAGWDHWGHGYFIDCAEATSRYAIAYDWLYNAFLALGKDVNVLSDAIYNKGVRNGAVSSMGNQMEGTVRLLGDESNYIDRDDFWNAVGASGMIIGAMAIMDRTEYLDDVYYLVGNNVSGLCLRGLDVYAPDGAFIESATNWCYATTNLFKLIMSFESAAGKTYGFSNVWGLDKTCYYALHIESSDGVIWNYHDGGFDGISGPLAGMETQIFYYVGKMFSDEALISVRAQQLASGKKQISVYDLLFYPHDGIKEEAELPLTYYMSGLEAYIVRSDWSDGALYTGLMGGPNDCNYGQLDSGNFIYHNKGVVWFMDLGSENTGVYDYYGTNRNRYYRVNSEGQNIFMFNDGESAYRYGQSETAYGIITSTFENEYGSYAILNNTSAYESLVLSANRGLFVTNDKKTVVIQDEVNFRLVREPMWIAHTAQEITLSEDGRTAWLLGKDADNKAVILRASIVSPTKDLAFSVDTTYQFALASTYGEKDSVTNGGAPEYNRKSIKKLVVSAGQSIAFDAAIALEVVESLDSNEPVGYEWQTMSSWVPYTESTEVTEDEEKRGIAKKGDIRTTLIKIDTLFNSASVFNKSLDEFYKSLTLIGYTFNKFPIDKDESLTSLYTEYLDYIDVYEDYMDYVLETVDAINLLADRLCGIYVPGDSEEDAKE